MSFRDTLMDNIRLKTDLVLIIRCDNEKGSQYFDILLQLQVPYPESGRILSTRGRLRIRKWLYCNVFPMVTEFKTDGSPSGFATVRGPLCCRMKLHFSIFFNDIVGEGPNDTPERGRSY